MSTPAVRQNLVAQYEQLRRDAIGSPARRGEDLGLALFLRRGMTAWMQASLECASSFDSGMRAPPSVDNTMPADMRSQITALLAGMILCLQQEAS